MKRRPKAISAIENRLTIVIIVLWLIFSILVTVIAVDQTYNILAEGRFDYASYVEIGLTDINNDYAPDRADYNLLDTVRRGNAWSRLGMEYQTATILYDPQWNVLFESSDFMTFRYYTQEQWNEALYNDAHYGYINLDDEEGELFQIANAINTNHDYYTRPEFLKITGTIEGSKIKPVFIASMSGNAYREAMADRPEQEHIGFLDQKGIVKWETLMDNTTDADETDGLITVYAYGMWSNIYDDKPVKFYGKKFDSMLVLTKALVEGDNSAFDGSGFNVTWGGSNEYSGYNLMISHADVDSRKEIFDFRVREIYDTTEIENGNMSEKPETKLIVVTGLYISPFKAALAEFWQVYALSFVFALDAIFLLRTYIRKHLIKPVEEINKGVRDNRKPVFFDTDKMMFAEIEELYDNYRAENEHRRKSENEITRLSTALDYAKEAEENRRQLTSSIAHELKTPLAIVRSYAEGLQEHIAEEKRDKYLEIIVSETDRMDAMVLEMLDLSRLEAGKVKLAQDDFSLTQMVRNTFEKFETLAAEKELRLTLDMKGELNVTADEARLGQVVTNFVSNAVRYTPHGGEIRVRAYERNRRTFFFIENTSRHFTEEEKQKIWETFYRTDKSRSSKGTGLGLAIAKNIVELHGGKVFVYNTELGVQFGFEI